MDVDPSTLEPLQQQLVALQQQVNDKDEALFELSATMATIQAETTHEQQKWQSQIQQLQQSLRHAQQEANLAHAALQRQRQQQQNELGRSSSAQRKRTRSATAASTATASATPQDQFVAVTPPVVMPDGLLSNDSSSSSIRQVKNNHNEQQRELLVQATSLSTAPFHHDEPETIVLARHVHSLMMMSPTAPPEKQQTIPNITSPASQLFWSIINSTESSLSHHKLYQSSVIPLSDLTECLVQLVVQEKEQSKSVDDKQQQLRSSTLPWLVRCLMFSAKCRAHVRKEITRAFSECNKPAEDSVTMAPTSSSAVTRKSRIRGLPNGADRLLHQVQERLREPLIRVPLKISALSSWQPTPSMSPSKQEKTAKFSPNTNDEVQVDHVIPVAHSSTDWQAFVQVISHHILGIRVGASTKSTHSTMAQAAIDVVEVLLSDAPSDCPICLTWFTALCSKQGTIVGTNIRDSILCDEWMSLVQNWIPPSYQTPRRQLGLSKNVLVQPQESAETGNSTNTDSNQPVNLDKSSSSPPPPSSKPPNKAGASNEYLSGYGTLVRQMHLLRHLLSKSHRCRQAFFEKFPVDEMIDDDVRSASLAEFTVALVLDLLQQVVFPNIDDDKRSDKDYAILCLLASESLAWLHWFAAIGCHKVDVTVWNSLQEPMKVTTTIGYSANNSNQSDNVAETRPRFGCSAAGVLIQLLHKIVLMETSGISPKNPHHGPMMASVVRTLHAMFLLVTTLRNIKNLKSGCSWKATVLSEYPDLYQSACHSILSRASLRESTSLSSSQQLEIIANICQMLLEEVWHEEK